MAAGVNEFITKPQHVEDLQRVLNLAAGRR